MIKIRVTGQPADVERFLVKIKEHFLVLEESKDCRNSNSKYVRKYVDVQEDTDNEV